MANQNITFDVASGTPYESNLTINGGANFSNIFTVTNPNGTAFNFTDYSGSSQMRKSSGTGSTTVAAATFTVGFTSAADGEFKISLEASDTRGLSGGRYDYDVLVKAGGATATILNTGVAVGHTVGVGSVNFIVNKVTDVAVGDSMSVGSSLSDIYVTGIAVTTSTVTIGSAHTHSAEILPGTAVTFTRAGTAASTYRITSGNVLVLSGVTSAP